MANTANHRVTISQVAASAGVSVGTVSNYLNGTVSVSKDKVSRIETAIHELHYIPDQAARSLRRKDTRQIYIVTPDLNNTFYTNIISAFLNCSREDNYTVQILSYEYSEEIELQDLKTLESSRSGAIVILFNGSSDEEYIQRLVQKGIHVILAERESAIAGTSSVTFDNEQIFSDIFSHLRQKGYRKIGLFTEPLILENIRKRHDSFLKTAASKGFCADQISVRSDNTLVLNKMKQGYQYMTKILTENSRESLPDAWVASSDHLAIGMSRAILEAGYRIPEDFGVIGFDNLEISSYIHPALTTAEQDREQFAMELWNTVQTVTRTGKCVCRVLPQKLIIRESC